jgi:hypothetical protein
MMPGSPHDQAHSCLKEREVSPSLPRGVTPVLANDQARKAKASPPARSLEATAMCAEDNELWRKHLRKASLRP